MLLAHHGPVAAGASLESAMYNLEEMEETAKVLLLVGKQPYATLNSAQIEELNRRFPSQEARGVQRARTVSVAFSGAPSPVDNNALTNSGEGSSFIEHVRTVDRASF